MSLAIVALALVSHRAYAPAVAQPEPEPTVAVESAPAPGYVLRPYCHGEQMMMHYEAGAFVDGTTVIVTLGGTTWLPDQPVRDVEWHGDAYGIYIRTPDGTVLADTTEHWDGC